MRDDIGPAPPPTYRPLTAAELVSMDIPPRPMLLAPWLPAQGTTMIYAPRGLGKTFLGLAIAYAVASGGRLMRWRAPRPRRVLYLDGEMPLIELQRRLVGIAAAAEAAPEHDDALRFLSAICFRDGLPDLASPEGRELLEGLAHEVDLLVLDNLSTLTGGPENEGDAWLPMQRTLLSLRQRNVSTLMIHHAGKAGGQRGTSRREDVLDTVIELRRPDDYQPSEGARCEVHYRKARGFFGVDALPFEARLTVAPDGGASWQDADLRPTGMAEAFALFDLGASVAAVAKALGVPRATLYRWKKQWREGGAHAN